MNNGTLGCRYSFEEELLSACLGAAVFNHAGQS